jgi:hypothetical protein
MTSGSVEPEHIIERLTDGFEVVEVFDIGGRELLARHLQMSYPYATRKSQYPADRGDLSLRRARQSSPPDEGTLCQISAGYNEGLIVERGGGNRNSLGIADPHHGNEFAGIGVESKNDDSREPGN